MRILVVDDEPLLRASLERGLRLHGYHVDVAGSGQEALDYLCSETPDMIVLDIMMPEINGLEVCRRIRTSGSRTPVLILTARDAVRDRVEGLEAGADDYLVKPFAFEELLARLRALMRRLTHGGDGKLHFSDLTLDPRTREVFRAGTPIELTRTEFSLMELLMSDHGRVFSREEILREVWDLDFETSSNTLEVYIGYLRRKLEANGGPRIIKNVHGVGYALRENP